MALSSLMLIFLGFIAVICLATVVLIYYIDKKYPSKDKKYDPYMRGILIGLFVLFMIILYQVASNDRDVFRKYWWVSLVVFGVTTIFYMIIAEKKTETPMEKLYRNVLWPFTEEFYDAHIPKGMHYYDCLIRYQKVEVGTQQLREVMGMFLFYAESSNLFLTMIGVNVITKRIEYVNVEPDSYEISRWLGREAIAKARTWREEFEENKNVQQEAG